MSPGNCQLNNSEPGRNGTCPRDSIYHRKLHGALLPALIRNIHIRGITAWLARNPLVCRFAFPELIRSRKSNDRTCVGAHSRVRAYVCARKDGALSAEKVISAKCATISSAQHAESQTRCRSVRIIRNVSNSTSLSVPIPCR